MKHGMQQKYFSKRIYHFLCVSLVCAGGGVLLAGCHSSAPSDTPAVKNLVDVQVVNATIHPMENVVQVQGVLATGPGGSVTIMPVMEGRLSTVLVRLGDVVKAGQLLATLDSRSVSASAESARAAMDASVSQAQGSALSLKASQQNYSTSLQRAEVALQTAIGEQHAAIVQAQTALQVAQNNLAKSTVAASSSDFQNALEQARLELQTAQLGRDSNIHAARNALLTAQADLQKLQAGARPQEISSAEGAVAQAQATRDRAATELKRVQFLFQKGIKARRDVDDAQTALQVDDATLQQAKSQLSLLQAGARPQELKTAQVQVDDAGRAVKQAQQSGDASVAQAQSALNLAAQNAKQTPALRLADVHDARLQVDAARSALQTAKSNGAAKVHQANLDLLTARQASLQVSVQSAATRASQADVRGKAAEMNAAQVNASSAELRAPISGVITARNLSPGDLASPSTAILKISNLNGLGLSVQVSSAKGESLRPGMSARIRLSNALSKVLWGKVENVGQVDPQTNLLPVRIAFNTHQKNLKEGDFATAEIITGKNPYAVAVPQTAILMQGNKSLVMLMGNDGKAHQQFVVTGARMGNLVEVTSGLSTGEKVINAGQYQLSDGDLVRVAPSAKTDNGLRG